MEVFNDEERGKTYGAFQLSMPISYRVRTEVPEKSDLQADSERYRRNLPKVMQRDEGRNHRSGGMRRSHSYARKYTTIYECSTVRRNTQEQKYINDIRPTRKS